MLRIRPFSLSDLDSLLKIENLSFPKSPYDWTTFLNLYGLYSETFLVYHNTNRSWKKEKIGGYIIFTQHGHIISIAVHPQYRRKGIGTQLLQRVMKTSHLKKVWAEVRRSNQSALVFYSKMGFQMTGVIPNYYGNEDALMIQWAPAICESD